MFPLFETIRIDNGIVCHLPYHQQRVDRSIGAELICLKSYIRTLKLPIHAIFKLRISYTQKGIIRHTISPYEIRPINTFRLVTDNSIQYDYKWEERSTIEHLSKMRNGCDDILIVRNNMLTDGSFANLALFDGQQWVTPHEPLLAGTCRARLLDEGILIPVPISMQDIWKYQQLLLINALLGFNPSRAIRISEQNILAPSSTEPPLSNN